MSDSLVPDATPARAPAPRARTRRVLVAGMATAALVAVAAGGALAAARDDDPAPGRDATVGGSVTGVAAADGGDGEPSGLTVAGRARTRVPADEASVVLVLGDEFDGGVSLSDRDRTDVLAGLEALGIGEEAVDIDDGGYVGSQVTVDVALADLPGIAERVEEAVEDVAGRASDKGVRFRASDCTELLRPARDDAVERARAAAVGLADAAGVDLGGLRSAVELPSTSGIALPGAGDPCGDGTGVDPYAVDLEAYDAEPELELEFGVAATFAIGGAPGGSSLRVEGVGRVEVDADRATVVVLPGEEYEIPATGGADDEERDDLVAGLLDLGIAEEDVRYESDPTGIVGYGAPVLQVDVEAARVAELGERIVDVAEEVLGSTGASGVVYSSSRCAATLVEAQRAALEDAEARIEDLARAADVALGGITRVAAGATSPADVFSPFSPTEPCDDDPLRASIDSFIGEPDLRPFEAPARTEIEAVVVLGREVT